MTARLKFKGSLNGTSPIYKELPIGVSQTLYAGDIVAFSGASTNTVIAAADAQATRTVVGVMAEDYTTTSTITSADVAMVNVNPDSIYEIVHSGTATPVFGDRYDLATAPYIMDSDDTTGGWIQVVGNVTSTTADVILLNSMFR